MSMRPPDPPSTRQSFVPAGPAQHEPFCTVLLHELSEAITASNEQFSRPTRRLDYLLRQKLVQTRWFAGHYRIFVIWNRQPGRLPVCATLSRRASLPTPPPGGGSNAPKRSD